MVQQSSNQCEPGVARLLPMGEDRTMSLEYNYCFAETKEKLQAAEKRIKELEGHVTEIAGAVFELVGAMGLGENEEVKNMKSMLDIIHDRTQDSQLSPDPWLGVWKTRQNNPGALKAGTKIEVTKIDLINKRALFACGDYDDSWHSIDFLKANFEKVEGEG